MNAADFDMLFAYSDACWKQLHVELSQRHDLLTKSFSTTSPYTTVQKLIAHCIGAEERWITKRICGEPLPVTYEERTADTLEGLFADARTVRARTDAFRKSLGAGDYHRLISFPMPPKNEAVFSVSDILFHILNHENYHRGQVVARLQESGGNPAYFDYVFLKPDAAL